jgi:hypothetical protein
MNLIEKLKQNNYSLVASNGYYSCDSGIKPIINKMNEDIHYFKDLEIADKIVGKASSMLLILSGIKKINAIVLSKQAKNILDKYNIEYTYEQLVEYIINRKKDGMCPMEETVKDIDDLNEAFIALNKKIIALTNSK